MKRKLFIPLFTITLLLLGGCNEVELNQKMEMQLVTLNVSTRSPEGNSSDVWQKDDKIAVFTQQNQVKQFQFNEVDWQPVGGENFYSEFPGTFFGVFPAAISPNCTIPNDQSTTEKLRSADYMSSDNVQLTDFRQPLNLAFKHRLTKVEVTITEYKSEFGGNIPTVTNPIFMAYNRIARQSDGSTMLPTQSLNNITPLFTEDNSQGKHKFEVLIAPGEYEKKFTCVVNGKGLSSTLPLNLEEGKVYRFNLTVGKDAIKLNTPQITDFVTGWDDEVAIDYTPPKVGDYLYSDGKWGAMDRSKTPVGVIFSTQTSDIDKAAGYRNGYAISMSFVLAEYEDIAELQYKTSNTDDVALQQIQTAMFWYKKTFLDGRTETLAVNDAEHPAAQAALGFKPIFVSSPIPGASEWFLPSFGQWAAIFENLAGIGPDAREVLRYQIYWYKSEGADERLNKYIRDWGEVSYQNLAGEECWGSNKFTEEYHSLFAAQGGSMYSAAFQAVGKLFKRKVRPAIAF